MTALSPFEQRLMRATQAGLPLVPAPYAVLADRLGATETQVIAALASMQDRGIVRRIAVAPNHYALGMTANGMSVWDVGDDDASRLGAAVGALEFVSHCYLRPRAAGWPYNLFAMLHGRSQVEVEAKRATVRELLGAACRSDDILYSTRILKKTGMRLRGKEETCSD